MTQYILEEDNDNIPLIEYEYGYKGKHHFIAMNETEWIRFKLILDKNLGEDNYTFIAPININDDNDEDFLYNDIDNDEMESVTY